jgi:hypothetical protein
MWHIRVLVGKTEQKRSFGRSGHSKRVICNWILKKQDGRVWKGFTWPRIGTSSRVMNMIRKGAIKHGKCLD